MLLFQILRQQGFQKHHRTVSIGQGMEHFQRNAVFVDNHTNGTAAKFLPVHARQRIAAFLPDAGTLGQLLQIVPEYTAAQAGTNGRKAGRCHVQRFLQNLPVHRFF